MSDVAKLVGVQIGIGHPFYVRESDVRTVSKLLEAFEERTQGCSCGSACARCAEPDETQPETQSAPLDVVDASGVAHGYTEADDALHDELPLATSVADVLNLKEQLGGKTGPSAGALRRVLMDYERLLAFYNEQVFRTREVHAKERLRAYNDAVSLLASSGTTVAQRRAAIVVRDEFLRDAPSILRSILEDSHGA